MVNKKQTTNHQPPITIHHIGFLKSFQCLAEKCEDTCCKGWGMQVDSKRLELYREKAPELLDAVTSGETAHVMKRHKESGACVKLDGGLCSIQKTYGTDFLPDACHSYPRITRKFGDDLYVSASLSCPEIARLALYSKDGFSYAPTEPSRTPGGLKDYLSGINFDKNSARLLFEKFINLADDGNASPERIISRLLSISESLEKIPETEWFGTIDQLAANIDNSFPTKESETSDPYNLLNILAGLAASTKNPINNRLLQVISSIEEALGVRVNWQKMTVELVVEKSFAALREQYYTHLSPLTVKPLHNWLKAQLAASTFPFGGLGNNIHDRVVIIAVRFATLKLAIMSNMQQFLGTPQETMVFLAQSLARFMDHLADPELSISCYKEAGWNSIARLRGLIGDN